MSHTFYVNDVKCRSFRRFRKTKSLLKQVARNDFQRLVADKPGVTRNSLGQFESPDTWLGDDTLVDLKKDTVFRLA